MKVNLLLLLTFSIWTCCFAPPVTKSKENEVPKEEPSDNLELAMHYHRYLKEVVGTLESDNDFKKKLEAADEADIRSGKIAHELEFVSHQVRTRLDELKRQELDRLRSLKRQLSENEVIEDPNHGHLDHVNPHTFEIEDLKKLIHKTTQDLAEADKKRREEFKEYEMQKEYEKFEKLNHTNGDDERKKLEQQFEDLENKHKKHQPLHEPGHKAQLEEVWEEQDHMQQEFDPKTFFMMHDLDSNGLWDQNEVKALFVKELDKMYTNGAPEDDLQERLEEMERMREQVFQEVDVNKDNFIDFHEFLAQTKKQDFQQDNGWKGLDEQQKPYSDQELEAYIRQHHLQQQGYYQGHPGQYPPPGGPYHPNQVPQYQGHPNDYPQGYPQHQGQMGSPQHPNQGYQGQQQYQPHPGQQQYQPHQGQQQYQPNPGQQQYQPHVGQQQYQPNQGQVQYQPQHPQNPQHQQKVQNPQQQQNQLNPPQQQQNQQNLQQQQNQQNLPQQQNQQNAPPQQHQNPPPQQNQQNSPPQQQQNPSPPQQLNQPSEQQKVKVEGHLNPEVQQMQPNQQEHNVKSKAEQPPPQANQV